MQELFLCSTILICLFGVPAERKSDQPVVIQHASFQDFGGGSFGRSNANLYVSKAGVLQIVNRWDLNDDGYFDLFVPNDHDLVENADALVYWNRPKLGFDSLLPPFWEKLPLSRRVDAVHRHSGNVTRLPAHGGGRGKLADVNGDGHLDVIFCNFMHNYSTRTFAYLYLGGPDGIRSDRRIELPTLSAKSVEVADLNRDGFADLVFANYGFEYGYRFGFRDHEQSYIYWGSPTGFDPSAPHTIASVSAVDCAAGDLNRDGFIDLVFANNHPSEKSLFVYWGSKTGLSDKRRERISCDDPNGITISDLNADGYPEIIVTNNGQSSDLFWGSSKGFSQAGRQPLETLGATGAAAGDLNRDGYVDLVFANHSTNYAIDFTTSRRTEQTGIPSFIYWGSSQGFSAKNRTDLPTLGAASCLIEDLNGDSFPDLVFANSRNDETWDVPSFIYWGSSQGFAHYLRTELQTFAAQQVSTGDLNNDGLRDLFFTNLLSGRTQSDLESTIYWGNPHHFYSPTHVTRLPTRGAFESSAADLNDDGWVDLVISNSSKAPIYIYWGREQGFTAARRLELPLPLPNAQYQGNTVADLNRDGHLDILVTAKLAKPVEEVFSLGIIFWGNGADYALERAQQIPLRSKFPFGTAVADLNQDGHLDLLFPDRDSPHSEIFWGGGGGYSADKRSFIESNSPSSVEVADLNADGYLDLIFCNSTDLQTLSDNTPSYIYWGSASGFSTDRRLSLESFGAHEAAVADLNRDGYLDLVLSNYHADNTRTLPVLIYWGGADYSFSEERRSALPAESSCGVLAADLNQDDFIDLIVFNHVGEGDHNVGSWIYWGGREGFSVENRHTLPSSGPHFSSNTDPGNQYSRALEEEYISAPVPIASSSAVRVAWQARCPPKTSVRLQVRSAADRERLEKARWRGPSPEQPYFERPDGSDAPLLPEHTWFQYRVVLQASQGGSPRLASVRLDFYNATQTNGDPNAETR